MMSKDDAKRIVQKHFIDVSQEDFEATLYRANPWLKAEKEQAQDAKPAGQSSTPAKS